MIRVPNWTVIDPAMREVFMRYRLTSTEVARILGATPQTVRVWHEKGRRGRTLPYRVMNERGLRGHSLEDVAAFAVATRRPFHVEHVPQPLAEQHADLLGLSN